MGNKTLNEFISTANFMSNTSMPLTDEQKKVMASELMDEAKECLSVAEIEVLSNEVDGGDFYTELSMYEGEIGGFSRH